MPNNAKYTKEPLLVAEEDENTFGRVTFRRICTKRDKYLVELSLNSNYEYPEEAERNKKTAFRLVAAYNATAGIPTEELEAGVIGEMREVLQKLMDAEEKDATRRAVHGGLGAGEWESFLPDLSVWQEVHALLSRLEGK